MGLVIFATSCGCDFCTARSGSYRVTYEEESGNCGPLHEEIVTLDRQPTAVEPPCTGSIDYSSDNCEVTFSATCPDGSSSTGKALWDCDGAYGEATIELTAPGCSSIYHVEHERL